MNEHNSETVRCSYHIHAKLSDSRRYLRIRCRDGRCPDAVVARDRGQVCIHIWDLSVPWDEQYKPETEFEMQIRRQQDDQ